MCRLGSASSERAQTHMRRHHIEPKRYAYEVHGLSHIYYTLITPCFSWTCWYTLTGIEKLHIERSSEWLLEGPYRELVRIIKLRAITRSKLAKRMGLFFPRVLVLEIVNIGPSFCFWNCWIQSNLFTLAWIPNVERGNMVRLNFWWLLSSNYWMPRNYLASCLYFCNSPCVVVHIRDNLCLVFLAFCLQKYSNFLPLVWSKVQLIMFFDEKKRL